MMRRSALALSLLGMLAAALLLSGCPDGGRMHGEMDNGMERQQTGGGGRY